MARYIIRGGNRMVGSIEVPGAKNAALPILAAALLTDKQVLLHNCPCLADVENALLIMESLGCGIKRVNRDVLIDPSSIARYDIPDSYVKEIRSSIIFIGALLGRMGRAKTAYPGGCEIGRRPIDLHLKGLSGLGVVVNEEKDHLECIGEKLTGSDIHLEYPSVGATENIMLAASCAKGRTVIENAAKEPEIEDLQGFLNAIGGEVQGAGTSRIIIEGKEKFHDAEYTIIPDRIVAGTFMISAAISGGDAIVRNIVPNHVGSLVQKLKEAGCEVSIDYSGIRVKGITRLKSVKEARTLPYPGFPTDLQAQLMSMLTIAEGTSVIVETIFESRFKHVDELVRMGANILVNERTAVIKGVARLKGGHVKARDLRGGAALVLAGIGAEGETVVEDSGQIVRGYENFDEGLRSLGAAITKA